MEVEQTIDQPSPDPNENIRPMPTHRPFKRFLLLNGHSFSIHPLGCLEPQVEDQNYISSINRPKYVIQNSKIIYVGRLACIESLDPEKKQELPRKKRKKLTH